MVYRTLLSLVVGFLLSAGVTAAAADTAKWVEALGRQYDRCPLTVDFHTQLKTDDKELSFKGTYTCVDSRTSHFSLVGDLPAAGKVIQTEVRLHAAQNANEYWVLSDSDLVGPFDVRVPRDQAKRMKELGMEDDAPKRDIVFRMDPILQLTEIANRSTITVKRADEKEISLELKAGHQRPFEATLFTASLRDIDKIEVTIDCESEFVRRIRYTKDGGKIAGGGAAPRVVLGEVRFETPEFKESVDPALFEFPDPEGKAPGVDITQILDRMEEEKAKLVRPVIEGLRDLLSDAQFQTGPGLEHLIKMAEAQRTYFANDVEAREPFDRLIDECRQRLEKLKRELAEAGDTHPEVLELRALLSHPQYQSVAGMETVIMIVDGRKAKHAADADVIKSLDRLIDDCRKRIDELKKSEGEGEGHSISSSSAKPPAAPENTPGAWLQSAAGRFHPILTGKMGTVPAPAGYLGIVEMQVASGNVEDAFTSAERIEDVKQKCGLIKTILNRTLGNEAIRDRGLKRLTALAEQTNEEACTPYQRWVGEISGKADPIEVAIYWAGRGDVSKLLEVVGPYEAIPEKVRGMMTPRKDEFEKLLGRYVTHLYAERRYAEAIELQDAMAESRWTDGSRGYQGQRARIAAWVQKGEFEAALDSIPNLPPPPRQGHFDGKNKGSAIVRIAAAMVRAGRLDDAKTVLGQVDENGVEQTARLDLVDAFTSRGMFEEAGALSGAQERFQEKTFWLQLELNIVGALFRSGKRDEAVARLEHALAGIGEAAAGHRRPVPLLTGDHAMKRPLEIQAMTYWNAGILLEGLGETHLLADLADRATRVEKTKDGRFVPWHPMVSAIAARWGHPERIYEYIETMLAPIKKFYPDPRTQKALASGVFIHEYYAALGLMYQADGSCDRVDPWLEDKPFFSGSGNKSSDPVKFWHHSAMRSWFVSPPCATTPVERAPDDAE